MKRNVFFRSLSATTLALILLTGCGAEAPAPSPSTPATPAATPAATPVTTPDPVVADTHSEPASAPVEEASTQATPEVDATPAPAEDSKEVMEAATPKTVAALPPLEGPEPRLGTDYRLIDPPQTLAAVPGKVEIAEVFSYTCIHCARLDLLLPAWKQALPEQINFVYAPMSHGAFEPIARGFYAAQAMGVLEQTHSGMFKALAEQHKLGAGKLDDIAKLYGELGVDPEALKATASSFAINTQITRSQRALARWAIEGTPTLVVAGKYVVVTTADRGHEGMLQTARWLALREAAEQAQ